MSLFSGKGQHSNKMQQRHCKRRNIPIFVVSWNSKHVFFYIYSRPTYGILRQNWIWRNTKHMSKLPKWLKIGQNRGFGAKNRGFWIFQMYKIFETRFFPYTRNYRAKIKFYFHKNFVPIWILIENLITNLEGRASK